jgi:hypothetical protein
LREPSWHGSGYGHVCGDLAKGDLAKYRIQRRVEMRLVPKKGRLLTPIVGLLGMAVGWIPDWVWAGGEKATNLVVVADTRRVSGIMKYFANLYNTNTLLFAVWAVVLTVLFGALLGLLMDWLMSRTGIDLKTRKIIEH